MDVAGQFTLAGKTAFITGGGGGLGVAVAEAYLASGASVVISDVDADKVDAAVKSLEPKGTVIGAPCDVTDAASVADAVGKAETALGKIDILMTAAGFARRTAAVDLDPEEFDRIMAINVKGTFLPAQAVARGMIARGQGGKIITIGSVRGLVGHPLGYVSYGTSKGAVHLLTRQLATEWAQHSINVNCIAPSVIKTPLADFILKTPEVRDLFMSRIPFNRPAEPEEFVGAAIFLAARASDFVTGHVLFVDGGSTAG
ncbi:glucose 1-dehydrogenase [Mesorhizobium sp. YC-39]|uniref:SDR family NAD(P)-dependent oxidoreductase n=1 Tax=unclassified Mesorhizobium TaxID=325217 RepID=UPI0021E8CDE9|nr:MULTISPECIES: glucose 1-dehydrogenase [unclassified Mesorhizobium]MCV3206632.1 glucose 1-dehydrogenase [Mesorhizobium sp. YC-2]MCV3226968.1 glucose 1-dehydrogenase [Mesorhizobium sp. YC-39]